MVLRRLLWLLDRQSSAQLGWKVFFHHFGDWGDWSRRGRIG
jgi:hypothetical protein